MKLYTYFRSSAAYRVRIALNLKGLEYEPAFVHLAKGAHNGAEFAAINPVRLLPALDEGGHLLTQSIAIMEYMDEMHPVPALLPGTSLDRARVRALSLLVACEIHPLNNLRALKYLNGVLKVTEEQKNAWYRHWVEDGLARFEAMLGDGRSGRFCHGDTPSMADCCLVPQVANGKRFDCDFSHVPRVMRIWEACNELPAFQRAAPAAQPDAE
ncbi:MAG: maleylacetoacetate isomerase [Burkholderiales bacterium]|nr:maleylacetoacetate isomerase [Burkholderiales bacterium]